MPQSQISHDQPYEIYHEAVIDWLKTHREALPTPLYLYHEATLTQAVASLRSLFPAAARGFYSLKANPQSELVRQFVGLGIGAEIAGEGEWRLCQQAAVPPAHILTGGVSKSEPFLETVWREGAAAVVIESETEWRRLSQIASDLPFLSVLLRINPGVSFGGLNMAGGSQFGLSVEQAIPIAHQCTAHPHLQFQGLHFYFGSQRLEVAPILEAVGVVAETIQAFRQAGIVISVVDLGLGCGVPYLAKDNDLDAAALREQLHERWATPPWSDINLWFEAGRALVARAGYFVARVIERKRLHGATYIFLDGGLNTHNPGVGLGRFFRRNPQFQFITAGANDEIETINIVGNLCTTADTLGTDVAAPHLGEGDLVIIPNAGAYCQTTALWGFNSQPLFFEGMLGQDGDLRLFPPQYQFLSNERFVAAPQQDK